MKCHLNYWSVLLRDKFLTADNSYHRIASDQQHAELSGKELRLYHCYHRNHLVKHNIQWHLKKILKLLKLSRESLFSLANWYQCYFAYGKSLQQDHLSGQPVFDRNIFRHWLCIQTGHYHSSGLYDSRLSESDLPSDNCNLFLRK